MPTTLPTTGPLGLANVNYVLSFANNRVIALDDTIVRLLFVKPLGTISISDGRGKAVGGTQSYLTAGTYYFTIPAYVNMTVTVNGAGGGGDGGNLKTLVDAREANDVYSYVFGGSGSTGGGSSFGATTPMIANGGGGGNATNGTASGGVTSNTTGGGAARGNGGTGVLSGGGDGTGTSQNGTNGGAGGRCISNYVRDAGGPTVGAIIAVVVGAAGAGGSAAAGSAGTAGGTGSVLITWSGVN
jgi:hypothetical protein